ncbi:hypothetical protein EHQ12_02460 [Leptospira gomenensis]|uniref:DUF1566 domain-containing protein n=1 Tax=Leptospira gomenensis TaxID=2484974 RepID=A0A5F1Y9Z6_9LEPT|nr:hypothetical protein [Leptospira gomenensis]TGK33395.1 hypothetical protein EHQ17_11440 [Leptospira gomenensis]TGK44044.1 hypothetical protein EHQ12_02460 [Leptospira gomenensis]TGK46413.1 hypothetical protein EHQ07_06235 [Leptospira gomenensis]TGK67451.1 hypothetical protein EHQ13_02045 [Leptospira gomenensis]
MANKRRPPRKKHNSNQKGSGGNERNRENSDSNRGGNERNESKEGNRRHSHQQRQQHGKNFHRNQEFHRKSQELAMENNVPKVRAPRENGKYFAGVLLSVSILVLGIFSYFICENYHTKTPVYGKRGWDDSFNRSVTWAEAKDICEEKSKRLPGKDQLKNFSKRADQKLKNAGVFWSSSPDGDSGYYFSVNFKDGVEASSLGTMKYNVICVK